MKYWKWDIFVISFIVSFLVAMMIVVGITRVEVDSWGIMFVLALILSAGFTLIKGLLKRLCDMEDKTDLLEARLRELGKKIENK